MAHPEMRKCIASDADIPVNEARFDAGLGLPKYDERDAAEWCPAGAALLFHYDRS